jgi:hypothetical protein
MDGVETCVGVAMVHVVALGVRLGQGAMVPLVLACPPWQLVPRTRGLMARGGGKGGM